MHEWLFHYNADPGGEARLMVRDSVATIDLWLFHLERFCEAGQPARCEPVLDAEESARAGRYSRQRDRDRYVLTRALVRNLLSHYEPGAEPRAWRFEPGSHGKPVIVAPHIGAPLHFNLSHSDDRLAVAVSRQAPVGVDVEVIARVRNFRRIARRLAEKESAELCDLAPAELQLRFYEIWTLKESYVKASGVGLTMPLRSFTVSLPESDRIELNAGADVPEGSWHLWLFDDRQGCRVGLATGLDPGTEIPEVRVFEGGRLDEFANQPPAAARLLRRTA